MAKKPCMHLCGANSAASIRKEDMFGFRGFKRAALELSAHLAAGANHAEPAVLALPRGLRHSANGGTPLPLVGSFQKESKRKLLPP